MSVRSCTNERLFAGSEAEGPCSRGSGRPQQRRGRVRIFGVSIPHPEEKRYLRRRRKGAGLEPGRRSPGRGRRLSALPSRNGGCSASSSKRTTTRDARTPLRVVREGRGIRVWVSTMSRAVRKLRVGPSKKSPLTSLYGRAPKGERAFGRAPRSNWGQEHNALIGFSKHGRTHSSDERQQR